MVGPVKLHHFILKQVVPSNNSDCILSFLENGSKNYLKFREERFLKKENKLADTIKRIAVPKCSSLHNILQYDLTRDCPLFDEVGLTRHKKHKILKPLESDLQEEDYNLNQNNNLKTAVVVDLMSRIRKVPFHVHKNINETL